MTPREAITKSQLMFLHNRTDDECILYVSQLEGRVKREVLNESFTELTVDEADTYELSMPAPYDMAYVYYIAAMCAFANGEYERYQNIKGMSDGIHGEYLIWYLHRRDQEST